MILRGWKFSYAKAFLKDQARIVLSQTAQHYLDPKKVCPLFKLCPKYYEKIDIDKYEDEILRDKILPLKNGSNLSATPSM